MKRIYRKNDTAHVSSCCSRRKKETRKIRFFSSSGVTNLLETLLGILRDLDSSIMSPTRSYIGGVAKPLLLRDILSLFRQPIPRVSCTILIFQATSLSRDHTPSWVYALVSLLKKRRKEEKKMNTFESRTASHLESSLGRNDARNTRRILSCFVGRKGKVFLYSKVRSFVATR